MGIEMTIEEEERDESLACSTEFFFLSFFFMKLLHCHPVDMERRKFGAAVAAIQEAGRSSIITQAVAAAAATTVAAVRLLLLLLNTSTHLTQLANANADVETFVLLKDSRNKNDVRIG